MGRVERAVERAILLFAMTATAWALPPALERLLPTLPPAQRAAIQARAATWHAMTPAQQQAWQRRRARWQSLPMAVQRQRREQWQAWQAWPADQRARVRAAAIAFAALPPEQQRRLRQRFAALDRSERRGWLLGPELGADYGRLQPLLAQVPQAQREPLLAQLRTMSGAEREALAVLAQRTAPQQRDALRRGLLATPADRRTDWLRSQLEQ